MQRKILSLDRAWRFHLGEVPYKKYMYHDALYTATKTASSKGPGRRDFDDSSWRLVDLPHDYVVEGTPSIEEPPSQGSLARENAWYRRTFLLDEADRGRRIALHFEGVATSCIVHVNGQPMFRNYTAGVGFDVDITDIARYGEDPNVVAVYLDQREFEGWYYEGGGIYRHVWLVKSGMAYVDLWGTFVRAEHRQNDDFLTLIDTEIVNRFNEDKEISVLSEIIAPDGRTIAGIEDMHAVAAREKSVFVQKAETPGVTRWNIENPVLYTLKTTVKADGEITDTYETSFGYRTIRYTASDGFFCNDKKYFLVGYGSHQDSTGFGAGIPDSISEFRMARLKACGFNIFRTAHNPFAPALYDACDRLGLFCMDENRWFSSSPQVQDEVARMVKRDRNHPSIIMWSLFNEEFYRDQYQGTNIYTTLSSIVRKLDPTRPHTGADNVATAIPGMMEDVDLIGINHVYQEDALDQVRINNPEKPIFLSEEGLTDFVKNYCVTRPHIFGAIGFGGLPYRGETRYPYLFSGDDSHCTFNLLCDPLPTFYKERAQWTTLDSLKIVDHWTYPGEEGKTKHIRVYANTRSVELFLNGKSVGKMDVDPIAALAAFDVPYMPGALKAVGTTIEGKTLEDTVITVGEASRLAIWQENPDVIHPVRANGRDTAIISVSLADENGNLLPEAEDLTVRFDVKQGGRFLAVGSPNRGDHDSWKQPKIRLSSNKAQLFVEATADDVPIIVEAQAEEFAPVQIEIAKQPAEAVAEVSAEACRFLDEWLYSRTLIDQPWPDVDAMHRAPNFNFWTKYNPGRGNNESFTGLTFPSPRVAGMPVFDAHESEGVVKSARLVHFIRVKVPQPSHEYSSTVIRFEVFEGAGCVYVYGKDKRFYAEKQDFTKRAFDIDVTGLQPGEKVEVWAVLQALTPFSAINRPVRWIFNR